MDYKKIHDQIIERAMNRNVTEYTENHHIIPKCLGGTNEASNLVKLTAREHFIIHKLLCEIYPTNTKIFFAYRMMAIMKNSKDNIRTYYISAREFERIRIMHAQISSDVNKGRVRTIEHRQNMSNALRGKKKLPMSQETKDKISIALKGRTLTLEHRKKVRDANKGNIKCTGKALTLEKELERCEKIKQSWIMRKKNKSGGIND